jgi:predicted transcriptional regulator
MKLTHEEITTMIQALASWKVAAINPKDEANRRFVAAPIIAKLHEEWLSAPVERRIPQALSVE